MNPKRIVLLTFAIGLLLFLAYLVRNALLVIYVSTVFAVVLYPAVEWICAHSIAGRHPSRGVAILLVVLLVLVILTLLIVFAFPPVLRDLQELATQLPEKLKELAERIKTVPFFGNLDFGAMDRYMGSLAGGIALAIRALSQALLSVITAAILSAYLVLDAKNVLKWTLSLYPEPGRERLRATLLRAGRTMRRWMVGQALLMLILGSASIVTFGLLGIRYFYLLGIFAGVANIIPLLGPLLTVIVASLIAAMDSSLKVLGVLIFYFIYQQVENAYLAPKIMESQVGLPATAVLVALLIGAELAGIAGALVAVPSAVLIATLLDEYVVKR